MPLGKQARIFGWGGGCDRNSRAEGVTGMKTKRAPFGMLSADPLVVLTWWYQASPFEFFDLVADAAGDKFAIIIVFNAWSLVRREAEGRLVKLAAQYHEYRALMPNHHVIWAANDAAECAAVRAHGIPAAVFNHNAFFVDYQVFDITPAAKRFTAVYNARITGYKRQELMAALDDACLIYASVDTDYADTLPAALRGFAYPNGDPFTGTPYRPLNRREVAAVLNESQVGLCLSQVEGAMFASLEYLLCGLPVVTTPNLGGRDFFFNTRHVVVAEPTATGVRDAVAQAIARKVDAREIRAAALARLFEARAACLGHILRLCAEHGQVVPEQRLAAAMFQSPVWPGGMHDAVSLAARIARG